MLFLEANHIEKRYVDRLIFEFQGLKVYKGDRIGVVGLNGAGKTTLLNILSGQEQADAGEIAQYGTVAIMEQFGSTDLEATERIQAKWQVKDVEFQTMSGGERTRLKIAHAIEKQADLLFADEPTSHLDLEGIEAIEKELKTYTGAVFLISHDRTLLDQVCTKIVEVEDGKVNQYNGDYSAYREQKEHETEREQIEFEQYEKEKKRLTEAAFEKETKSKKMRKTPKRMGNSEARLHKTAVQGKKAKLDKNVKTIEKRIEQLGQKEKPKELPAVQFDLHSYEPIHGKTAIELKKVNISIGSRTLLKNFSCMINPGSKIAVTGNNGAGKSTLLNHIMMEGDGVRLSQSSRVGFFNQTLSILDPERTILENVSEDSPYREELMRTVLARLLFKREEVFKRVGVLSGGEKVKAALAKVFLGRYNVLLLDEPTNYLDIFTQEELEEVLKAYPGTILFATHDRRLMNHLADHILAIADGEAKLFQGNYQSYLESNHKLDPSTQSKEHEIMKLENEIAEIVSRLSILQKGDNPKELDKKFHALTAQLRELKYE